MAGSLEVIAGCMYSGKSEELLRRVRRAIIAKQDVVLFKPLIDDRYGLEKVRSHSGHEQEAICINQDNPVEIIDAALNLNAEVIAIEEVQFFNEGVVEVISYLADMNGKRVMVSGLDQDFRGEPFGVMPTLLAIADKVTKLSAVCMQCGDEATRTQRLINGEPAPYDSPTVLVGETDFYEARCRACHEVGERYSHTR